MISTARPAMYPALKELWKASFGDDLSYAGQIIDNLPPEQILVLLEKNQIQSMLCWLPIDFPVPGGEIIPGAYMFGFNAHPSCRGKGVGGELLRKFHDYMDSLGIRAVALAPAGESLFGYYARFDYETAFSIRQAEVRGEEIAPAQNPCVLLPRSLDMMFRRRHRHFGGRFYGRWGGGALRFLGEECLYRKGEILSVSTAGAEGYLALTPLQAGTVMVNEFAVPPQNAADALATLHQRVRADRYLLRLPTDYPTPWPATDLPFVMVRWYDKKKQAGLPRLAPAAPYFAFILD